MEREKVLTYPGMIVSTDRNMEPGRGTIRTRQGLSALFVGLKEVQGKYVHVIPLKGLYHPQVGDKVIGKIINKTATKWIVDINSKGVGLLKPQDAVLRDRHSRGHSSKSKGSYVPDEEDVMEAFKRGDFLMAKVLSGNRIENPELSALGKYLGKITKGLIVEISPPKIPRVIGKRGSMIKLLKDHTKCNIFVTQNGRIWIHGPNEDYEHILVEAILKIEKEAHTSGLTDRINAFLLQRKEEYNLS